MPNDPLELSDVLAALPQEPDYDVAYAALTATQRGRWFLREFADRNRHADTHILLGALARVEAAMRGDPAPRIPAFLAGEFADLGAALDRIEAEIGASGFRAQGSLAATERLQDVAFTLRDREVDPALCEALETAVSELSDIVARNEAAAEQVQSAASLLRQLSRRINGLIAQAAVDAGASVELPFAAADALAMPAAAAFTSAVEDESGADDTAEEDAVAAVRPQRVEEDAREDESFAAAVGALAASFPQLEEVGGQPVLEPRGQLDAAGGPLTDEAGEGDNDVMPASEESAAASTAIVTGPSGSAGAPAESAAPAHERAEPAEAAPELVEYETAHRDTAEQVAVAGISPERSAPETHVADDPLAGAEAPETIEEMVKEAESVLALPLSTGAPSRQGEAEANPADAMTTDAAAKAPDCSSADEAGAISIASRASEPPTNRAISCQESFSCQELSNQESEGEALASEKPATERQASEELPAEQSVPGEFPSKEMLHGEQSSSVAASEESSSEEAPGEHSPCRQDIVERADQPAEPCARPVDIAAVHSSDIESAPDDAGRLFDTPQVPAIEASPAAACGHHGERLRQAGDDPSALTESQTAAGPEEDPGDLFEPLPLQDTLRQAEAARQASPEPPAPTCPPPQSPARSSPAESSIEVSSPQPRAARPMVRDIARSTPTDPLASVRALSEEELVALFS